MAGQMYLLSLPIANCNVIMLVLATFLFGCCGPEETCQIDGWEIDLVVAIQTLEGELLLAFWMSSWKVRSTYLKVSPLGAGSRLKPAC